MESIVSNIIRELPSTGVLIIFVWFVGKQFDSALKLLSEHLDQLNKMIENCIESKQSHETELKKNFERDLDRKFDRIFSYIHSQQVKEKKELK